MDKSILDALNAIDPSSLNYEEWIEIGMALKAEGASCSVWEDWSARDFSRYHPGECDRKWDTFSSSGVTAGTIIHIAETQGYKPNQYLSWDDSVEDTGISYYEDVLLANKQDLEPWEMAIKYLEVLFDPDDIVGYVHSAKFDEDRQKWVPENAGTYQKQKKLIQNLTKYKSFDTAFGTINEEAGAWIRINALDGKGAGDKNVTRFTHALVEADTMTIEEQKKFLIGSKLPIAALLESGGKSVHAVIKIDAKDKTEFKQRVDFLFDWLNKHKFVVDEANKNPSRLSRLPGVMRNGKCQTLLATDIGCPSWDDWLDEVHGVDDDLPDIINCADMFKDPPEEIPELIGGILRKGCKMIITADSKAGKSCLAETMAICIAEGLPWLGKYKCTKGRVLYIDLELSKRAIFERTEAILKELGLKAPPVNLDFFPMRGYAESLETLFPKIVRRVRNKHYDVIIIDPLYKIQAGDENSAEALAKFCNGVDRLARHTGAALIITHHHPKGHAGDRKAIDRGSGSGVIARDADALIDLSYLDVGSDPLAAVTKLVKQGESPMQMAFVLRDFKSPPETNIWFRFPIHYLDDGLLEGAHVEGSRAANLAKSSKRPSPETQLRRLEEAFDILQVNGCVSRKTLRDYVGGEVSGKTLITYAEKFTDKFEVTDDLIFKKS